MTYNSYQEKKIEFCWINCFKKSVLSRLLCQARVYKTDFLTSNLATRLMFTYMSLYFNELKMSLDFSGRKRNYFKRKKNSKLKKQEWLRKLFLFHLKNK